MNATDSIKTCLYSGKEFCPKRNNQKFANDEYRVAYHNHRNNLLRLERAKVDRVLHKNHKILVELMDDAKQKRFKKDFLEGKGFSFNVLTGFHKYGEHWVHKLYNYIMFQSKDNTLTVIKINDE